MNSVLVVDVAENKSIVALITEYGEVLIEPYEVIHNPNNFNLDNLTIFMESTSTYYKLIQRYLKK